MLRDSNNDWFMLTGNKTTPPSVWQHCKTGPALLAQLTLNPTQFPH